MVEPDGCGPPGARPDHRHGHAHVGGVAGRAGFACQRRALSRDCPLSLRIRELVPPYIALRTASIRGRPFPRDLSSAIDVLPRTIVPISTATNTAGTAPPTASLTASTASTSASVTSNVRNLAPASHYSIGSGAIGVNVHVNPSSAAVQVGLSTSSSMPPSSWSPATYVNTDLWGAYIAVPSVAGTYYVWAAGMDGSASTVYPTPVTVS